ncbi:MAG: hypothetical protein JNK82_41700 [Myxococcaceae bacterium]|nr:hypothetical protein [Myxococcaceae bacterium]
MRQTLVVTASLFVACSSPEPGPACGAGTVLDGDTCVAVRVDAGPGTQCGAGTVLMNGVCVAAPADGGSTVLCGPGTVLVNGVCVAVTVDGGPGTQCGPGTTRMGNACVPDGTVICGQGTRFVADAGMCVLDPSACAAGTVRVGGRCLTEDATLTADLEEATDGGPAGRLLVPAATGAMTTLHGCITPVGGARDEDVWLLDATGPTALEITVDGVGGLAAGFVLTNDDVPALSGWSRVGINLTGDTSKRQVFLPTAGTYALRVDDSRAILLDEVSGSAGTCYFATVERIQLPAATPLTVPEQAGSDTGELRVLTHTATARGDILRSVLTTTSASLVPAFTVMMGNQLVAAPRFVGATQTAAALPPQWTEGGLEPGAAVTFVIDHVRNTAAAPAPYTLSSLALTAQALPTDGGVLTVTGRRSGTDGATDLTKFSYLWFDVAAPGSLLQWNLAASMPLDMFIVRKNVLTNTTFQVFALVDAPGGTPAGRTAFNNEFTRHLSAGRYYLIMQNPLATAMAGETFTVTSALTPVAPVPVVYNTPLLNQPLPASGWGFHSIDFTSPTWVEFAVTATGFNTGLARVQAFDPAGEGWLGSTTYAPVFAGDQAPTGAAPFGRILVGDDRDYLLRVTSTTAPDAGATYSLAVRDRPHTALTVMPGTPVSRIAVPVGGASNTVAAQNVARFLVTAPAFSTVTAAASSGMAVDLIVRRRGIDEASVQSFDTGLNGATETLVNSIPSPPLNYVAFTVGNFNAGAGVFDLNVSATPPPYAVTSGTLPFVDACGDGGTVLGTGLDDTLTPVVTLPAGFSPFPFFGAGQLGNLKVSSNGWLTFDTAVTSPLGGNTAYPNAAAPNALVSPYAEDLVGVTLCTRAAGTTFTVQWSGYIWNNSAETAEFQAVLHQGGVIDFIYGPRHLLNGSEVDTGGTAGATVGLENATGTSALQLLFNSNGIAPSTSRTLTP